jgi:hypothetical protein
MAIPAKFKGLNAAGAGRYGFVKGADREAATAASPS